MFDAEFLRNLPEVPGDNPWPLYPTTRNYRTQFVGQADYLLGFENNRTMSFESALLKYWPEDGSDPADDDYENPVLIFDTKCDAFVPEETRSCDVAEWSPSSGDASPDYVHNRGRRYA
jgi:hypothetical protein